MEKNKKIVGITCSTFDLLHAGHLIMLEECKKYCDYLICALQVDPSLDRSEKNKPVQSLVERFIQLDAVQYVDKIIPYNNEKELEIMQKYKMGIILYQLTLEKRVQDLNYLRL
jgi:glycerol-3-phosphate cytidylyltransferase